ncbi:endonuclease/exonuclease/phosphatase family protein [Arcicella rigui]|uniref:Endonuclease/exonuclease/phosphatase family protein n=1 Tax=Arcicella rigui TaxID=797020 RepID=A0ABU5QFT7_9BACT|nr:endonuclease/exonuclease/phosphatase family protein [Arcicella rigui]MEA5141497.1 endonuclease/exonuclease/phosphatase family protein [Arcicella rigui]
MKVYRDSLIENSDTINIAFWNINKKELSDLLVEFTHENNVDILCLAEVHENTVSEFIKKINSFDANDYKQITASKDKVIVISRYPEDNFIDKSNLYSSKRFTAHYFQIPLLIEFNLITLHFHSKQNWSDISQAMECATLAQAIREIEKNTQSSNTIVIGDFNMNPFEIGMLSTNGFHAIPDLALANQSKSRKVDDVHYPFFYNPMWNFFGDFQEPSGTFYYRSSQSISYEWHIFDQVIFRPSVAEYLDDNYMEIITKVFTESLLSPLKRPDSKLYSDHLPIIFKLNTRKKWQLQQ